MKRKKVREIAKAQGLYNFPTSKNMALKYESGFIDGAEWRINSVWHDANEEPKYDEFFLYENVIQAFHVDIIFPSQDEAFVWDDYVKDWGIMRWAYIKDLIPNIEE